MASFTGLLRLCERRMRRGVTILMYHRILPAQECREYPLPSLVIPREVFAAQVAWLTAHCEVRTVTESLRVQQAGELRKRPLVALTFDDGYADNHDLAAPIMEAAGCRGTFFITTGFVQGGVPLWFDRAADAWTRLSEGERLRLLAALPAGAEREPMRRWMEGLKRAPGADREAMVAQAEASAEGSMRASRYLPMSTEQIRTLHVRGHEVASHTVTHPILTQLDDETLRSELFESKHSIEAWTGEPVAGFCYPNGTVDARVARMTAEAGYVSACTTQSGLNREAQDPFLLRRLSITMHRTARPDGSHHELGFRGEVSRMRELWRA